MDYNVFERIKQLVNAEQFSVDQLMQARARWACDLGHAGEPYRDVEGHLRSKVQPGRIWVGTEGWKME